MQISFTREEVFLQLKQDGGRATSPACPVCHCDFNASCPFFRKELKVVKVHCVYINAIYGYKYQSVHNSWQSFCVKLNVSFKGRNKQRLGWGA